MSLIEDLHTRARTARRSIVLADAADPRDIVRRLERAVVFPVLNDGFGERGADAIEFVGKLVRIGRIDVDGPRKQELRTGKTENAEHQSLDSCMHDLTP